MRTSASVVGILAVSIVTASSAGAQAPGTDIYIAPLADSAGHVTLGAPVNITNRRGYDNQPSFTPDGAAILFTSTREDGQADIYRYDRATHLITRVTTTPESEYSATVMPNGRRFSVVRVEKDSTQRLWSFALDGSDPRLVVATLKPVGYHAWIDATHLALYVLGSPNALAIANLRTNAIDTVARNIGRALAPLPDGSGFSFVRYLDSTAVVTAMRNGNAEQVIALPRGNEFMAWLPDGTVLHGAGARLLAWRKGAPGWVEVADFAGAGVSDITRLAVSPDGKWLAFVAADPR